MGVQQVKVIYGDISNQHVDVIVNAANGIGYMGGFIGKHIKLKGVAESLHYATKGEMEKEVKNMLRVLQPNPGDVYLTTSCRLPAMFVFHAVTMPKPRRRTTLQIVEKCLYSIIEKARELQIKSIAIPLLGAGTGRVPASQVRQLYEEVLGNITDFQIYIVEYKREV